MNPPDFENRMAKLEIAMAHLQRDYDSLNSVVTEQAGLLDRYRSHFTRLQQQVEILRNSANNAVPRSLEDDRPPHY